MFSVEIRLSVCMCVMWFDFNMNYAIHYNLNGQKELWMAILDKFNVFLFGF